MGTGQAATTDGSVPDIVAQLRYQQPWGHVQLAGLGRRLNSEGTGGAVNTDDDKAIGWGLHLSGRINTPFIGARDNLRFQIVGGDGIGRYIQGVGQSGFDSFVNADGELETVAAYGGNISFQHFWSEKWRSNVIAGFVEFDAPDNAVDTQFRRSQVGYVNVIYSPIPRIDLGIEGQYGRREDADGASGDVFRIQSSAKFSF